MVEDRWFQKVACVNELCMSANELCVKELRVRKLCVTGLCVKKLRVKELCVRKLACFFPRWVKVGLPSDAVESRGGMFSNHKDANWPAQCFYVCPARRISPSPLLSYLVTNQAFAQRTQVRVIPHHRPPRWQATMYQPDSHRSMRHDMKRSRDVYSNNTQRTHAQRRENKRCQCFFRKVHLDAQLSYQCVLRSGDLGPTSVWTSVRYRARRDGTTSTRHDHRRDLSWSLPHGSNNSWPCRQASCGTGTSAPAFLWFPGPSCMKTVTAALLPQSEKGWMFYSMLWIHDDVVSCVKLHWGPDLWCGQLMDSCLLFAFSLSCHEVSFFSSFFPFFPELFACLSIMICPFVRCRSWFLQRSRL